MLNFYRQTFSALAVLIIVSLAFGYMCIHKTFLRASLLPAPQSAFPWRSVLTADSGSTIKINDTRYSFDLDFNVGSKEEYPYTSLSLMFLDHHQTDTLQDLSRYTSLHLNVKCAPSNTISFRLFTVDEALSEPGSPLNYRTPATFFACNEQWSEVDIDLTRLVTPQWWFDKYGLDLSKVDYNLKKVAGMALSSTHQSQYDTDSNLHIGEVVLHGRDWRYAYLYAALMVLVWSSFGVWFFRQHSRALIEDIKSKLQKDRPLVAYQQLSIAPQKSKDKSEILRFMSTEYANEELSLELMVTELGVSRTKINAILKEELGYTFSAYLNKLRLTEAARLLSASSEANVAEIAYSVGYKNVSYFNKLFKTEYGCTPKTFKKVYKH